LALCWKYTLAGKAYAGVVLRKRNEALYPQDMCQTLHLGQEEFLGMVGTLFAAVKSVVELGFEQTFIEEYLT
jgi:hypothetical protein